MGSKNYLRCLMALYVSKIRTFQVQNYFFNHRTYFQRSLYGFCRPIRRLFQLPHTPWAPEIFTILVAKSAVRILQTRPRALPSSLLLYTSYKVPISRSSQTSEWITGYIDDLLFVGQTFDQCLSCITDTFNLFNKLSFIVNRNKSVLTPVTLIEHLGFSFDSRSMTMTLIQKRKQDIIDCIQKVTITSSSVRIRDVCRLIGLFVAA